MDTHLLSHYDRTYVYRQICKHGFIKGHNLGSICNRGCLEDESALYVERGRDVRKNSKKDTKRA